MTHAVDIAIFGGGIAGLWSLARLQQAGYRVALFERHALGGVQSIASQGIIHGGTKYALTGKLTGSAMAIGEMPGIWRAALRGEGEIDLRKVRILAEHQLLWSTGSLASSMAGFFAGKVMQSRMQALDRGRFPPPFDDPGFRGGLYRLEEPVLDPRSLMQALQAQYGDLCYRTDSDPVAERHGDGWTICLAEGVEIRAAAVVLAAGRGNADLLSAFGQPEPAMQLRPLHMLMLRGELPPLHAHCLGASANPRLTVTSAPAADGRVVWYLGGQVAEEGIERSPEAQLRAGRDELAALLPWMTLDAAEWATLRVDRAEIASPGGRRPDDAYVGEHERVLTCWPTKLAFAPRVARLLEQRLVALDISPTHAETGRLPLSRPPLARLPWDEVERWN